MSQFGHTDHTTKDHSHPAVDPADRTFHGYYESQDWGKQGLDALLATLRARPASVQPVADTQAAVIAQAQRTGMPDGATVTFTDTDGSALSVGSQYKAMLTGFTGAYDAGQSYQGMRGYTADVWTRSVANVDADANLLASLYLTAWQDAAAAVPLMPPAVPGLPMCPNQ